MKAFSEIPEIKLKPRRRSLDPFDPMEPTLVIHQAMDSPIYKFCINATDGPVESVWVTDEAEAKRILLDEKGIWRKGQQTYEPFSSLVPLHLISLDGEYHTKMREKAQNALANAVMSGRIAGDRVGKSLIEKINQQISHRETSWMGHTAYLDGRPTFVTKQVDKMLRACALEIVTDALFGQSWNVVDDYTKTNVKANALAEIMHELHWRVADFNERAWRRDHRAGGTGDLLDVVDKFLMDEIELSRLRVQPENNANPKCMLDEWAAESDLSMEEIRNLAMTFLTMGSENVSTALSWCLILLSEHQEAQEKSSQSFDNLNQAFEETLRLYPSVPVLTRACTERTSICGYEIPRCTEIIVNVYATHRLTSTWGEDSTEFKYSRCPVVSTLGPPDAFPFGAGKRACVGRPLTNLELKTVLLPLLNAFKVVPVEELVPGKLTINPNAKTTPNNFISLRPGTHLIAFLPKSTSSARL